MRMVGPCDLKLDVVRFNPEFISETGARIDERRIRIRRKIATYALVHLICLPGRLLKIRVSVENAWPQT